MKVLTAVFIAIGIFLVILITVFSLVNRGNKREKRRRYYEEWGRKLPNILYTKILDSSTGIDAKINSFGTVYGINTTGVTSGSGSIKSSPKTKFLIVYKSKEKEIITVGDGTWLFNELVKLLEE